jgi:hypothetical protein
MWSDACFYQSFLWRRKEWSLVWPPSQRTGYYRGSPLSRKPRRGAPECSCCDWNRYACYDQNVIEICLLKIAINYLTPTFILYRQTVSRVLTLLKFGHFISDLPVRFTYMYMYLCPLYMKFYIIGIIAPPPCT